MNVTIQELMALLGERDVEIYLLKKQLEQAAQQLAALSPKDDAPTPAA